MKNHGVLWEKLRSFVGCCCWFLVKFLCVYIYICIHTYMIGGWRWGVFLLSDDSIQTWEVLHELEVDLRSGSPIAFVIKLCQEYFLIDISRRKGLLKGLGRCEGATNSGILNQPIESPENRVVIVFFRIDPTIHPKTWENHVNPPWFQFPPKPCGRIPSWLLFWSIL